MRAIKLISEIKRQLENLDLNDTSVQSELLCKINSLKDSVSQLQNDDSFEPPTISEIKLEELLLIKKELEESKANLTSQIENTRDNIWSVDTKLNIKTINSNFKSSYKLAFGVDLIVGMNVLVSLPEPILNIWKERYQRALNGEHYGIIDEFNIDNIPNFIETSFNPVNIDGKYVGVSCFARDITELKLNQEKFRQIFENSYSAISIQTAQEILLVNKAWEKLTGYHAEDIKDLTPFDLIHPESKTRIANIAISRLRGENAPNSYQFHMITKQGQEKWIDLSVSIIDYLGQTCTLIVANDGTEIYDLQENVLRNEATLISYLENSKDWAWSVNKKLKITSINRSFHDYYQHDFDIDLKEGSSVIDGMPRHIAESWVQKYRRALRGEKLMETEELIFKNKALHIEVSLNPIRVNDQVIGVTCLARDLSELDTSEQALKETEQRYKALVSNIKSVSYRSALDYDRTIDFVSDEIKTMSGYTADDFIQNKTICFGNIIHPEDKPIIFEKLSSAVNRKEKYNLDYRIVNADKEIHWINERGMAHYSATGDVLWLDGVFIDITKQKNAELSRINTEEKYKSVFNSMVDVYIRTNVDGLVEIVSPSVYDIFGYKTEEVIGNSIASIYKDPQQRERILALLNENGKIRDYEAVFIAKDGREITASLNSSFVRNANGEAIGIDGLARDISSRKLAEQSLQEKTLELNTIFNHAPIILLLIGEDNKVINVNQAASSLSKKGSSESPFDISKVLINCLNAADTNAGCGKNTSCQNCKIRRTIKNTFATKKNQNQIESSLSFVNGSQTVTKHFIISTTYIELKNTKRVLISFDDISAFKEAQEQVKRLSAAVEQSTATIVITDIDGKIQYANPQFEKSTGYKLKEVLGKNPRMLKSKKTKSSEYKELWTTILSGQTWKGEFLNLRKNGTEYWENAIISPIFNDNGEIISFIAIKEDITERKRIMQELVKSEKELRQFNDEKNRFISILAHDLRGLVGGYHAYSDLIYTHLNSFNKDELKEHIINLSQSSGESLKLLDNLLEWAKASLGVIKIMPKQLSLSKEINDVFKTLKDLANSKEISLTYDNIEDIELSTDPNILQTIFRNLINNSIKFTNINGEIKVRHQKVSDNYVELSVEDNGIGMNEKTRAKLFKPGEIVIREGTKKESGTGLGLLICDEMIKRLGGKIKVDSEVNKGSRFYFQIPIKTVT